MKKILGSCIGDCVHVAGVLKFLETARQLGYETIFLGPAIDTKNLIEAIREHNPDIVGLSYRLTPENGIRTIEALKAEVTAAGLNDKEFLLGGLPTLVEQASQDPFFARCFKGDEDEEIIAYLKGTDNGEGEETESSQELVARIDSKRPLPLLRHHFGLATIKNTAEGIRKIAESRCLDIISLGTDQDAQANFFHPERRGLGKGAGGVPVRSEGDFKKLYEASRTGNYPLMRTYAGSNDLIRLAEVYLRTINNAWSAIPIFWFNQLDGRGPMPLEESIKIHLEAIKWHADKNIPVEILESHHWSMRDAKDEIAVAAGYLGALICKKLGVKRFISQYMFNTPPQTNQRDDLAKMLAQKSLIESLSDEEFQVYTQTRTGLFSYPINMDMAKGQLASSTMMQMQLNPEIVHVVSYSEANHAATAEDVIASCQIARQVIKNCLAGQPRMDLDPYVTERQQEIQDKAEAIVKQIVSEGDILDQNTLTRSLEKRILHAPQLDSYLR